MFNLFSKKSEKNNIIPQLDKSTMNLKCIEKLFKFEKLIHSKPDFVIGDYVRRKEVASELGHKMSEPHEGVIIG